MNKKKIQKYLEGEAGRAHPAALGNLAVDVALRLEAREAEVDHLQLGALAVVRQKEVLWEEEVASGGQINTGCPCDS